MSNEWRLMMQGEFRRIGWGMAHEYRVPMTTDIVEAVRSMPHTVFVVREENGEWPQWAKSAIHDWFVDDKGEHPASELLDALLIAGSSQP